MLVATPTGLGSWTFHLGEQATPRSKVERRIATVRLRRRDDAEILVGGVPFGMGVDRRRRHYALVFEGVEVARARQPSPWRRQLLVLVRGTMLDRRHAVADAPDVRLVLQAERALTRTFEVREADRPIGRLRPLGLFTRRTEVDLPPYLPPAIQAFLFALVAVQWRRTNRQAAAGG